MLEKSHPHSFWEGKASSQKHHRLRWNRGLEIPQRSLGNVHYRTNAIAFTAVALSNFLNWIEISDPTAFGKSNDSEPLPLQQFDPSEVIFLTNISESFKHLSNVESYQCIDLSNQVLTVKSPRSPGFWSWVVSVCGSKLTLRSDFSQRLKSNQLPLPTVSNILAREWKRSQLPIALLRRLSLLEHPTSWCKPMMKLRGTTLEPCLVLVPESKFLIYW